MGVDASLSVQNSMVSNVWTIQGVHCGNPNCLWTKRRARLSDRDTYINCWVVSLLSCFEAKFIDVLVQDNTMCIIWIHSMLIVNQLFFSYQSNGLTCEGNIDRSSKNTCFSNSNGCFRLLTWPWYDGNAPHQVDLSSVEETLGVLKACN